MILIKNKLVLQEISINLTFLMIQKINLNLAPTPRIWANDPMQNNIHHYRTVAFVLVPNGVPLVADGVTGPGW